MIDTERQEIINEAVKASIEAVKELIPEIIAKSKGETLLLIPETIGNLMSQRAVQSQMTQDFYKKYPEFKSETETVASVIEMVDGENPTLPYDKILEIAVPRIRERVEIKKGLNMTKADYPDRDFSNNGNL